MRASFLLAAVLASACACASDGPATTTTSTGGEPPPAVRNPDATPTASQQGNPPMPTSPGFDKALASFKEHAAQTLGVTVADLQGGPADEAGAAVMKEKVGNAWAMRFYRKDDPTRDARGWAVADGSVITPEQNLGKLFEEAGAWTPAPARDGAALAELLVWSMGMNHRVLVKPQWKAFAPKLVVAADGTGTLEFVDAYREPGPGGAGGGPEAYTRWTIKLTADHQAVATKSSFQQP